MGSLSMMAQVDASAISYSRRAFLTKAARLATRIGFAQENGTSRREHHHQSQCGVWWRGRAQPYLVEERRLCIRPEHHHRDSYRVCGSYGFHPVWIGKDTVIACAASYLTCCPWCEQQISGFTRVLYGMPYWGLTECRLSTNLLPGFLACRITTRRARGSRKRLSRGRL